MLRTINRLAWLFALLGGLAAMAVAGMTVVSIVGRALFGKPIEGDVELTQFGIAVCISLCLPWCQVHGGNIIVDFFTQNRSARSRAILDAIGALMLTSMTALLAWRSAVGAVGGRPGRRDVDAARLADLVELRAGRTGAGVDRPDRLDPGRAAAAQSRHHGVAAVSPTLIGLVMFAAMIAMMVVRVPIAAAMFIPGVVGYLALAGDSALLNHLKGSAVARLTVYDLSVIPLFLLMGQFATQGGLSRALFKAAAAFIGHRRGGLAMAAVVSAAAFGAVCGSSVATSATITQVAYPEMKAHGYHGRLSTATLAAGARSGS